MITKSKRLWISWEMQRRSLELARHMSAECFVFTYSGILRYPRSIVSTLYLVWKEAPTLLFVQNPSMILAALACILGLVTRTPVVVDRHSTFLTAQKFVDRPWLMWTPHFVVFRLLNKFTLKYAKLTIVTNEFLANVVMKAGGRVCVLPDPLPELISVPASSPSDDFNILFTTSFAHDEPIAEVITAMRGLEGERIRLYISGNYKKLDRKIYESRPRNVEFTGFLSDAEYLKLLCGVDAVIVLTTAEHTMLCGCYEAVAAGKPLITSNKKVLRSYFNEAIFVDNSPIQIAQAIKKIACEYEVFSTKTPLTKKRIAREWGERFTLLEKELDEVERFNTDRDLREPK